MWGWMRQAGAWLGSIGRANRVDIDSTAEQWAGLSHKINEEKERVAESLVFALDAAQMGQWDFDLVNDTAHRSLAHDRIFGYSEQQPEWCWRVFLKHVVSEDREAVTEHFRNATQNGAEINTECRIIWADQSIHWISIRGRTYVNDQGVAVRTAGVVMDITQRKQAEDRFRLVVESAPNAMVMIDAKRKITLVNKQTEQLFGYSRKELVGQLVEKLIPERFRPNHPNHVQEFFHDPQSRPMGAGRELYGLKKNGDEVPIEIGLNPITTTEGVFVLASIIDITQRKHAEEVTQRFQLELEERIQERTTALSQAKDAAETGERLARLIVESAYDAFVSIDAEGRIIDWNPQAEATFGWTRQEALGQNVTETLIPPHYREAHARGLRHFLTTGEGPVLNKRLELPAMHRNGHEFPVELTIFPVRLGQTFVFCGFLHDITDRQRAALDLQHAREVAERANRAKSEFLANMSHEIRTPMNGIIGMTELALDTDLTAAQREYLNTVKSSAESLLTLINDILDFSKIEAGKLDLDPVPFSLRNAITEMLKPLAVRADVKGLELAKYIHHSAPDNLYGDLGRLQQVLINLVGNAIKFTSRGEVVLECGLWEGNKTTESPTSTADSESRMLHFQIRDTGIGIHANKLDSIFAAFVQADGSMAREYGGTGLGLAISTRLVELMGGRIWAESTLGEGSTFHFTVRMGVRDEPTPAHHIDAINLHGIPVLVVDDNATNRRILQDTLTNWEMQPTLADGGGAALREIVQIRQMGKSFRIALIDINMPGMNGVELAERIAQDPSPTPTVLLMLSSVGRSREIDDRCRKIGVAGFLTKPITQSDLMDALMYALSKAKQAGTGHTATPIKLAPEYQMDRPLLILLADDNVVNQRVSHAILEKAGHDIFVASDGEEAVAAFQDHKFDLVLMDVQMPVMDGLTATTAIRSYERDTGRHTPIIALTAHTMQGDRERFLAAGMDDYVSKPIRSKELFEAIRRLIPVQALKESIEQQPSTTESTEVFDLQAALDGVDGDRELLLELAQLFLGQCPQLVAEIKTCVEKADAKGLERSAHKLKGSIGNFGAERARLAAQRLEEMGRTGSLSEAGAAYANLENQAAGVQAALAILIKEGNT